MSDNLFKLCITLIIFAIAIVAIVTVTYFVYQLLDLGEQRRKPRTYSRQASPQNLNQARQRRSGKPAENPYRNLPLDNQNFSKQKQRKQPEPTITPDSTPQLPPMKPLPQIEVQNPELPKKPKKSSIPDSIGSKQLEKLRKAKKVRPIAVNRGAPHEVLQLLRNDRAVANRLFVHVSSMNPGESEKWCWDKVVWDLERDRH